MNDKLKETQDTGPDGLSLVYLRVSEDAQVQIAVAYLRTSARGAERALALVEQQNAAPAVCRCGRLQGGRLVRGRRRG